MKQSRQGQNNKTWNNKSVTQTKYLLTANLVGFFLPWMTSCGETHKASGARVSASSLEGQGCLTEGGGNSWLLRINKLMTDFFFQKQHSVKPAHWLYSLFHSIQAFWEVPLECRLLHLDVQNVKSFRHMCSNRGTGPFGNLAMMIHPPRGICFISSLHSPHYSLGNDAILQLNGPFGSERKDGMWAPGPSGQLKWYKTELYISTNYLVLF